MAESDPDISEDISDSIASVVTNTTIKNTASNAILYQNVRTILGIPSAR